MPLSVWLSWEPITVGGEPGGVYRKGLQRLQILTQTGGRGGGSPVGSSVGAPPGGSPQRSSLWVDTFWTVSQRHSRQTGHSCNTCWKKKMV